MGCHVSRIAPEHPTATFFRSSGLGHFHLSHHGLRRWAAFVSPLRGYGVRLWSVSGGPHRVLAATIAGALYCSKPREINGSLPGLLRAISLALLSSRG